MHELHLQTKIIFFLIEHLDTKDSQDDELKPGQPLSGESSFGPELSNISLRA